MKKVWDFLQNGSEWAKRPEISLQLEELKM
jgi:hypothetical protein